MDHYKARPAKSKSVHCEEDIFRSLQEKGILLENFEFSPTYNAVIGTVVVVNLAYEKNVVVRCTFDNWKTFIDLQSIWAGSLGTSERPITDKFLFLIPLPATIWGGCVEFAVKYEVAGQTFWDSNGSLNYKQEVDGSINPSPIVVDVDLP